MSDFPTTAEPSLDLQPESTIQDLLSDLKITRSPDSFTDTNKDDLCFSALVIYNFVKRKNKSQTQDTKPSSAESASDPAPGLGTATSTSIATTSGAQSRARELKLERWVRRARNSTCMVRSVNHVLDVYNSQNGTPLAQVDWPMVDEGEKSINPTPDPDLTDSSYQTGGWQ